MKNKLKSIKRFFILLIISLILPVTILADTVAFKTVVSKNDMTVSGDFWLDVQMQITAGTSPRTLNSLTADVYFGNEISYSSADNWAYGSSLGYYRVASDLTDYIRVGTTGNSVGMDAPGEPPGWDVTTSWQTVVTLKFTIVTATSVNISIRDATNDAAYFNNIANNPSGAGVTDWTTTNEDTGEVTLPVELSTFSAVYTVDESGNEFVSVNWSTASETDVQGFNIYRSEYEDLSTVGNHINASLIEGAGNTSQTQYYSFIDDIANPYKTYYYWLQTVDFGGISEYYRSVKYVPGDSDGDQEVDLYSTTVLYNNYPNPAINTTTIKYQLKGSVIEQNAVISIYNIKGELVKKVEGTKGKAEFSVSDLPTGIYLYRLKTDNYNEVRKMIIIQ